MEHRNRNDGKRGGGEHEYGEFCMGRNYTLCRGTRENPCPQSQTVVNFFKTKSLFFDIGNSISNAFSKL